MFRAVRWLFSSCGEQASPRGGFSCCVHGPWESQAAVVVACGLSGGSLWALEGKLSGWAAQAYLLHDMWDLPGPGIEPMSPVLAGGFPTTGHQGSPIFSIFAKR